MNSYAEEVLKKLKSGAISGKSALNTRDESKQTKSSLAYVPWLKKEAKKTSRLIIPKEVAIPFDPFLCEETEQYNPSNKFRPFLSVSTTIRVIKQACQEDAELKERWENKTGVANWDVSDASIVTDQDKEVFRNYIVVRIFSINATKVNMSTVTGRDFAASYAVDVQRDPLTEQLVGEMPDWMKVSKLLSDIAYEEIKYVEGVIQSYKDGKPIPQDQIKSSAIQNKANLAVVSQEDQKKIRSTIRDNICRVSYDLPHNFIVGYELGLDNNSMPVEKLDQFTVEDVFKKQVLTRYSLSTRSVLHNTIEAIMSGNKKAADLYVDFIELDMSCPPEGSKQDIGSGTSYTNASVVKLKEVPGWENFNKAIIEDLDTNWENMEKRFLASCGIKQMTPEVEQRIINALPDYVTIAETPFATETVLKANANIISAIYGDELLMEIDAGISDKAAGVLDENASAKLSRSEDIAAMLSEDDDDDDDMAITIE